MVLGRAVRSLVFVASLSAVACDSSNVFYESLNPNSGRPSGGQEVRIRGSGFRALGNLEVRIGGRPATNVGVADDETIVLTTPEAREQDIGHGLDVYLLSAEGKSTVLRGAFTYRRSANDMSSPNSDLQRRL